MAKVIYGTSIMQENFWAYAVQAGKVALVRCETKEDAAEERDRMKWSNATTVGVTTAKVSEADMRRAMRDRGWKLEIIR